MRRRDFITLFSGAAIWPLAAQAQQSSRRPTIGFIGVNAVAWNPYVVAFAKRLGELGWVDGRTVALEYRWHDGRPERVAEIAAEFVQLKVDIIVTSGTPAPLVKRATTSIPIVFAIAADPIGSGLVASLSHPGGNVTGLSTQANELADKRIALLHEVTPALRRLAVMVNIASPETSLEAGQVRSAAQRLGLDVVPADIKRAEDIAPAFDGLKGRADALYVLGDALTNANQKNIIMFAQNVKLPAIFNTRDFVQSGGLMSYGPNYPALFRRAAEYVDKILHGAKPGDIPVEQPTTFELTVNMKTAKALGLAVPQMLLVAADEVIE